MKLSVLTAAVVAIVAPLAQAGVILQPVSASTQTAWNGTGSPSNIVNQSGLTVGYTSGVTDFDAYIASGPTHNTFLTANIWNADPATGSILNLDFDLGGSHTLESMALWNHGFNLLGNVHAFQLLVADNAAFTGATLVGSYTANPNTGHFTAVPAEVFTFAATTGSYARMQIDVSADGSAFFGEVAFEVARQQAVPEPGTAALVLACGLGWVAVRRARARPSHANANQGT